MSNNAREVLDLLFEFLLSLCLYIGAGFLLYKGIASELASGVIGIVTTFWFNKRSNESAVNNLLRQSPTISPVQTDNVSPSNQLSNITNSSNSPTTTPPPGVKI